MDIFDFKCKYCGADLENIDGRRSVATCKYCGKKQTLPRLPDRKRVDLFGRANHLRRNYEFDKAEMLYEQILTDDPEDPEAYWSLVLCRYGVVYIEDTKTKERIPTVNRAQITSIFADENYQEALRYADAEQHGIYEHDAGVINEIQRGILEISQNEEPFDVFICYKETDDKTGKWSQDSAHAYDLYRELTRDGYKVFFARETLKGKLGTAYEPYIFSALTTAKVMVVLGTKRENFEAVWVRNEWSRFLGQIKAGEKKALIPVYRGMDAYDLPQEFANLQALDMEHVGYLQELIAGVENIVRIYNHRHTEEHEEHHVAPPPVPVEEPKKKKYPFIISAIAFVLALAIGLGAFVVLNRKDNNDPSGDPTDTTVDQTPPADTRKPMVDTLKNEMYHVQINSAENALPADGVLEVDEIKDGTNYTLVSNALPNVKRFHAYDLSLASEGKPYVLTGEVTVTLPLPSDVNEAKAAVYYVSEEGKATEHKANVSGGNISFKTDHFSIYAIAEKNISDFSYTENGDGTVTVTGYHGLSDTIMIPESIEGKTVTAIGAKAFDSMDELTSVTIPTTVTSIGANAFYGCTSIATITIPDSVDNMGVSVFYGWSNRQTIVVGGRNANPPEWNSRWNATSDAKVVYSLKKITFHANSGEGSMADIYAEMNRMALLPACTFEKIGYTFAGWSLSADGKVVATDGGNFDMGAADEYTLYAVWTPNDNTLSFDANGGTGEMSPVTIPSDKTVTLPANAFTKAGYIFAGWATEKGGDVAYADASAYTMGTSESYTLYAVWTANQNTVTFHANGGTGSMSALSMDTDETKSLTENAFAKIGYTFQGWSETKGGAVKYADGASYTMGTGSVTLYAVWSANENKITLYANNSTSQTTTVSGKTDATITLPQNTFLRDGYTFRGWSKTAGGAVAYTDGASYKVGTANAALYAVWEANINTIRFDANGATGSMANLSVATDATTALPTNAFERVGWTFVGWSTERDGEVVYTNGAEYKMGTSASYTLYAVWEIHDYTIVYQLDGGQNHAANPNGFQIDTATITLQSPTRTGYAFKGWYSDADFTTAVTAIETGSHADITLWAKWEAETYTLTFDTNGSAERFESMTVTYDAPFTLPLPTFEGYTFLGWYSGDVLCESGTWQTTSDVALVAKWTLITYTITYDLAGGTTDTTLVTEYTVESPTITLPTPVRVGYTFAEWLAADYSTSGATITIPTGSVGDRSYIAQWSANRYTISFTADPAVGGFEDYEVAYGAEYTLPAVERTGYTFDGWYDGETRYEMSGTWQTEKDVALVAKWTLITYTITYDLAGGTTDTTLVTEYTIESPTITLPTPVRVGYTFAEWLAADYSTSGATIAIPTGSVGDRSYIAQWSANRYTISFTRDPAVGGFEDYEVAYGAEYTLPAVERTGYTFDGWYDGETRYEMSGIWQTAENITLTARWTPRSDVTYVVKHHLQNADGVTYTLHETENFIGATGASVTPETKTYENYVTPSQKTVTIEANGGTVVDYYYDLLRITITFAENGGDELEDVTLLYQAAVTPPTPVRGDFTFGGWFVDKDLTTPMPSEYAATENATLYAYWIEEAKPNLFRYSGYNNTANTIISKYTGTQTDVRIPAYIGGSPVTYIDAYAFQNCQNVTSVIIPDGVVLLYAGVFAGCTNLQSVVIPDSVRIMDGGYTFYGCRSLTSVTIPHGVTKIGEQAFYGCAALTSITIPDSVTSIAEGAFRGCRSLESMTLPFVGGSIKTASDTYQYPFGYIFGTSSYTGGTRIVQEFYAASTSTVTSMACYIPSSLKSVTITGGDILHGAFMGCQDLTSITIPDSVTTIGAYAFNQCSNLTTITFQATTAEWEAITKGSGWDSNTASYTVHCTDGDIAKDGTVTRYSTGLAFTSNGDGTCAVSGIGTCTDLDVSIPKVSPDGDCVTSIGARAFSHCTNLTSMTLPDSVTSIDANAIYHCTALTSVTLPHCLETIGNEAFWGCSALGDIVFPDSLTSIGERAFLGCNGLVDLTIPEGVTTIGKQAFERCIGLTSVTLPDSLTSIGLGVFRSCSKLGSMTLSFVGESKDSTTNTHFGYIFGATSYSENGSCVPLSLKTVTITGSTTIANYAFRGCCYLTDVIILDNKLNMGISVFRDCSQLTNVTLPVGVTNINNYTFCDCTNLQSFTYGGTMAQWNAVVKGISWDENTASYTVHCTDGDITA